MIPKIISNPYVMLWETSDIPANVHIDEWCVENLNKAVQFISWKYGPATFYYEKQDGDEETDYLFKSTTLSSKQILCLFECPRDAMLFKLTWIDNG